MEANHITEEDFDDITTTFRLHKIRTMYQVKLLNEHLLERMGIVALGHVLVLLEWIDEYKREEQQELITRANYLFDHEDSEEDDDFFHE
jgi:hypothetical protein